MPLGNLAQHPLMSHSSTQNLYSTFFLKISALPTRRLPCNKNIHYSHVTLTGMLHPCSMSFQTPLSNTMHCGTESTKTWRITNRNQVGGKSSQCRFGNGINFKGADLFANISYNFIKVKPWNNFPYSFKRFFHDTLLVVTTE